MELITIPALLALIEVFKRMGLSTNYAPFVSIILGAIIAYFFVEGEVLARISVGIVLGLSASGLYSGGKKTKEVFFDQ